MLSQWSDFISTLQELWYGNICPNEDKVTIDGEKKLIELIVKHHKTLSSSLKDDDLDVFEKYIDSFMEYASLIECQSFEIGFNLTVKLFAGNNIWSGLLEYFVIFIAVKAKSDLAIIPIMEYNKSIKLRGATNDWIYDCK